MTQPFSHGHALHRFFSGTVQQVFYADIGMCDPQITDYVADLLSSFVHIDDLYPFRDASGKRVEELAELVTEAELPPALPSVQRRRVIYRHMGDVLLFWTGVFPEGLRRVRCLSGAEGLHDYFEQGKRSYAIASELTTRPDDKPPAGVLQRLSDRFEYCVHGLNLCRKEWDSLGERRLAPD